MRKYLAEVRERLVLLRDGISANLSDWTGLPHTPATVQAEIDKIDNIESEISNLATLISSKQQAAKELAKLQHDIADGIENMMKSLYPTDKTRWVHYGVPLTVRQTRTAPSASLNVDVFDDVDGEGFIIKIQKADSAADMYIWQKGVNDDPSNPNAVPQLVQFRESSKAEITDDDVLPGKRYFYRVRAINNKGKGNWSDIASRVQ